METSHATRLLRGAATLLPLATLTPSAPARADAPDWERLADAEVVEVLTRNADGDPRETKVWTALVDGVPCLRIETR